jgi:hypothetical protein
VVLDQLKIVQSNETESIDPIQSQSVESKGKPANSDPVSSAQSVVTTDSVLLQVAEADGSSTGIGSDPSQLQVLVESMF